MTYQAPIVLPSFVSGTKKLLIGGKWVEPQSGAALDVINPANGQKLCQIASGNENDIDLAVTAARKAFEGEWSRWKAQDRFRLLMRIHDLVMQNFDELALIETMDMGAPLTRTQSMREYQSQVISFYAAQANARSITTMGNNIAGDWLTAKVKAPIGVVGGIIPWNAPLMGQWWILGPVLATGCTAVLKPAEDASLTALRMAEILQEAGVPDGVLNLVTGSGPVAGQRLAEHPDVDRLGFTGSIFTARHIVRASAGNFKRLSLELGGKSPDFVFADANMDKAVPGAAMACFTNSGQICTAGTRLFVERKIQDEFVERLSTFAKTLKVGDPLDATTNLGPLVSAKQLQNVQKYINIGQSEGAKLITGGQRLTGELSNGFYVEPAVFSGANNDMTIAKEEIFGPVVTVIPFDSIDEAIALGNATQFGLGGGIWSQNINTVNAMTHGIQAGTLWVNGYGAIDPHVGFGGYKMSGYGWKGSSEHVESFLYTKVVYTNLG